MSKAYLGWWTRCWMLFSLVLALVLLGANLLQVRSTAAQGEEPEPQAGLVDEGLAEPAPPVETPAAPAAAEADLSRPRGEAKVYLPMLQGRPQFAAQFATALDERLNPIAPGTAFPRGASEIYSVLTLNGAAGQRWNIEWRRNNLRIPGLVANGTIPPGQQEARLVRRLSYASGALPTGTYTIVLYLNDRRAFSADVHVGP